MQTSVPVTRNPYADVLGLPGARSFVLAGVIGRSAHLMTVLSIIFSVSTTRGYALAGVVAAGYQVGYSAAGPFSARLCDRRGQSRILPWAALATAISRVLLLAALWRDAAGWELVLLSALSGGSMPSVGSLVRSRWSHLLEGSPRLSTALSLESVIDDLIVVAGPIAVAMLGTSVDPAAGLIGATVLAPAGLAWLAVLRRTEPPARSGSHGGGEALLTAPGFLALMVTFVAVGATLYTMELATVAFCQAHGWKAASGWVLAASAAASAVAGIWYGARDWSATPERRLAIALVPFAGGMALFLGAWNIPVLIVPAVGFGATVSPVLIAGFSTAGRCISKWRLTEAMTWITTSMGIGIVLGTSVGGKAVEIWGARAAYGTAAFYAAVGIPCSVLVVRALRGTAREGGRP